MQMSRTKEAVIQTYDELKRVAEGVGLSFNVSKQKFWCNPGMKQVQKMKWKQNMVGLK